ncbi:hypothetical protein JCM8097_000530 [Rhodosporidiobolus ruineniae]
MRFSASSAVAALTLVSGALARSKKSKTQTLSVNFGDYSSGNVQDWLSDQGLLVSDWPIDDSPLSYTYTPDNVDIRDGALRLKVTGQAGGEQVYGAEVSTAADNILYGTFTAVAKASKVPGTCQGIFTYSDDNHEVDIELLSSYYTTGYDGPEGAVPAGLEFTNQPLTKKVEETNTAVSYGFDPTEDFHEYTIEWTSTYSKFYVDGELKTTFTTNVPKKATMFTLNNWSNGDPLWSAGPPTEDSYFLVKSIDLKYTTA